MSLFATVQAKAALERLLRACTSAASPSSERLWALGFFIQGNLGPLIWSLISSEEPPLPNTPLLPPRPTYRLAT